MADNPLPAETPCGSRRRGDVLEHAIFDAVLEQLATVGYGGLTMEGVAACSHTGKASLYRRWPSKEALLVDAVGHRMPPVDDLPDTGTVRGDILLLLQRMATTLDSSTGCAMHNLLSSAARDGDVVRAITRRIIEPRQRMLLALLERGVERGEVRPGAATMMVAQTGPALVIYHYLTEGPPVSRETLAAIVDEVVVPILRRG